MDALKTGLLHSHSVLRWVLLLMLILVIFKAFTAKGKKPYSDSDARLAKLTVLTAHFQLLIGFALYFIIGWHKFFANMGDAMKNTAVRFFMIEHLVGMLLAIVLITIGNAKAKRATDSDQKFKLLGRFFLIALVIILLTIPWPFREAFSGRGWL